MSRADLEKLVWGAELKRKNRPGKIRYTDLSPKQARYYKALANVYNQWKSDTPSETMKDLMSQGTKAKHIDDVAKCLMSRTAIWPAAVGCEAEFGGLPLPLAADRESAIYQAMIKDIKDNTTAQQFLQQLVNGVENIPDVGYDAEFKRWQGVDRSRRLSKRLQQDDFSGIPEAYRGLFTGRVKVESKVRK